MSVERTQQTFQYCVNQYDQAQNAVYAESETFDYQTVENFGKKWVYPRENFIEGTFGCLVDTIHNFIVALIKTAFAGISGSFEDEELNAKTIRAWKDTGFCARMTLTSAVGIIAPSLAKGINNKIEELLSDKENEGKPEDVANNREEYVGPVN